MKQSVILMALMLVISTAFNNPKAQPADTWHLNETAVGYNITLYLCNGDVIFMEQYTIHMDIMGVTKINHSMIQGKYEVTATGVSMVTGEVYTFDGRVKFNDHYPLTNGASVIKSQSRQLMVGNMGSRDLYIFKSHMIVNAKGQLVVDHYEFMTDCQ